MLLTFILFESCMYKHVVLDFNNLFYFNEKPESMKDQLELNSFLMFQYMYYI